MPLLGNRQFSLVKPLKDLGPDEMVFVIDHTKEAFRSKEEYLRRLQQYNQSVWTCQCTGNSNLTHQEATQSEQEAYQSLQKEFPECFKQPILELVHHSTQPLEALADAAHNKLLTELAMGEKVELKMKIGGKGVQGKVVKVTTPTPEEASSNCSSPSSDKENATGKGTSGTPKKSGLLPYKYNVRIAGEAKVISLIPAVDLHRVERIPSREFVQLFIRSYAIRSGQGPNSPWVVDEECVKKYNLPSKFSDFLVSPKRVVPPSPISPVVNLGKRKSVDSSGSSSKKRKEDKGLSQPKVGLEAFLKPKVKVISSPLKKVSNGPVSPSPKSPPPSPKVIAVNGVGKTPASPKTPKSPKTEKVKAEKKSTTKKAAATTSAKKKATIPEKKRGPKSSTKKKAAASSTDSEDDAPLSRYILIEKKKKKATPTKQSSSSSDEIVIDSSDDDIPLNELKRKSLSDSSSPTKKARKSPKKQTAKEKGSAAKKSPKKTPGGKKPLKQMTLFDLKKKKGGAGTPKKGSPKKATTPKKSGTPKKQPGTPKSPWQPPMIKKLVKMKKGVSTPSDQASDKRSKYGYLLWKVCKEFPVAVLKNAPVEVRAEILEKHKKLKEKERFKKMSEAEKAQFLEQKKEERKKELEKKKEERKKQREEEKKKEREEKFKRFEDQELKLKPLPQPAPVPMPEGLPNTLFGDVAMVVEFISCYYQLLMPEDNYPVTTDAIMKALVAGGEGFGYLSRVLVILLQTLLQDDIMEDHKEVGVALGDIPVTMHSASELVRLCLKKHEEEEEEEDESDNEDEEKIRDVDEVSEELLEKLETTEFHELEAQEKLEILVALTHKVMMSYAVEDHIQEKQQKAAELWKEKIQVLKERKVKRKEEKQKKKDKGDGEEKKEGEKEKKGPKKKEEDKKEEEPEIPMEDDGDLASIVRRRRVLAAQAQKEKAEREKRDREEREKEMEKMRKEREEQSFKTRFEEGIAQARRTLRWQHVGTDRHHNKYWLFSPQTPGLYVEKGWAHEAMGYQVTLPNSPVKKKNQQEEEEEEESDVESVSEVQSVTSEASTVRSERVKKHRGVEKTHPPLGQNLWFLYSRKDEVDKLMQNLGTQGIRESVLKEELEKRYQDIKSSLNNYSKRNQQLRSSDGDQELLDAYKRDLEEIETKLEKGGLGGVENPAKWLKRLEKTDKMSELGSLLVEVQAGVLQKFLKGMMAPQKKKPKEPKMEEEEDKEENKEEKDEQGEEENEEEEEEDDEDKDENEVPLYEPREVELWRQATADCSTMSRLHVLMGILDACIKWDKSAENAKCKVCRKKGEEERLLLCDECNQAYHIFCLRPALSCVPPGEWRCPACIPRQARVGSRGRNYREMDEGDYNSSEDDDDKPRTRRGGRREQEIVHREECVVCYEEGELVPCSTCPLVFHKECHIPALRNFPRGNNWVCCACQNPSKYRQLRKAKPSQPPPKQQPTRQTSRQTSTSRQAAASSTSPGTSSQSTNQSRASTQAANQGRSTAASRRAQQPVPNNKEEREELHSRRTNNELKTCEDILQKLMRNKSSVYFRKPVDVEDVPDYYDVIKNPMDLTTVKNKCVCLDYCSPQEFIKDVSCIFDNAHEYNKIGSDIRDKADTLEKYFIELVEEFLPSYDYPHKEAAAIHGMHNDHSYTSPQKATSNGK